jgi:diguanylate cyclase (GGDEF)-like protein
LLPATELDSALKVAERLRRTISRFPMYFGNKSCTITISIGIASDNEQEGNLENLMIKADKALFESKKRGRNRVCTSDERSS